MIEVKLFSHQMMKSSRGRNGTANSQGNPEVGTGSVETSVATAKYGVTSEARIMQCACC